MNTLKEQGRKAFFWDFFGKFIIHGMGFIVSIFLARLLAPSDFGLIAIVMVIIGIASIFSDFGLAEALVQRRHVLPIHYASVFYFNIFFGILLTILIYLSAPVIALFYMNNDLIALIEVASFSFAIGSMSSVQNTRLRRELNYQLLTKLGFAASLLSGSIGISLALNGVGVWSLVIQALAQGIIYNILIWSTSRWKPVLGFSVKALRQLWSFGFRVFLATLLETIFVHLDTIIIAKLFNPTTVGYFNRAKTLNQMVISYSSASLTSVLFPVLSKVRYDLTRFQNIIIKILGIISFVSFLFLGGLYLVSYEIIVGLFGEKWMQSVEYFKILILSGYVYPISALFVNVLMSRGNSKKFLRLDIYKKIVLGANLFIGFFWGIEGYLYGLVIASFAALLLNILFISKEISLPMSTLIKPIAVQLIISVFAVLAVRVLLDDVHCGLLLSFLLKGLLFTIIYIGLGKILQTTSYIYIEEQIKPYLESLLRVLKKD